MERGEGWEEEERTIVLSLLGGKRGLVESCISMFTNKDEAPGAQIQDADSLSASHLFLRKIKVQKYLC